MSDGARRRRSLQSRRAIAACLVGLCGCAAGPDFRRPPPPPVGAYLPPEESGPALEGDTEGAQRVLLGQNIPAQWWALFHSPRLDELLRRVIAANQTLVAAKATLAQAEEGIVQARAGLYPQADLLASAHRGNVVAGGPVTNLFSVGPSVSFSLDVFGASRRRVEQATALAENQRYQLAAAYLTLTGNSVTQAISLASAGLLIATVEDLIRNDERNLDLTRSAFKAGKVAKADVLTAEAQLASDRTQLPALHQQLSIARHALSVLSGQAPGASSTPDLSIEELAVPDGLPLSLPAEFVRQRPDILAAEAVLHADSAAIGVATAQMFPSITLSANVFQEALSFANLFGSSAHWGLGASAEAPLFHGGALASQRRAAIDAYEAALATYEQTVVVAFGQVADGLSALEHDAEMVSASRKAVDIAAQSLAVQRSSYAAGKTSALQLITAENTYSTARIGYVRALGQRLTDVAQLLVAVGGGWWNEDGLVSSRPAP